MSAHLGLILHVQVGNGSIFNEANNPGAQASYTWWCAKDGTLEQYVDPNLTAWAQAAGNSTYNSVGTEGYPSEPLTAAQCQKIADLYRWGHDTFGWPYVLAENPGEPGFGWHGMGDSNGHSGWGGHPSCPGDIRKGQRQHILDLAHGNQGDPDMAYDASEAKKMNDIWVAVTGKDASKTEQGVPETDHWALADGLNRIETMEKKLDQIIAKLGA
jgi:hypothetical protein